MPDHRAGVARIAARCGFSAMTVSRALRGSPSVSEATRRRVLKAAEEMGYRPRARMGRPRRGRSGARPAAEVILGFHAAPATSFYMLLLSRIEQELARRGCDCLIRTAGGDYDAFLALCETLRNTDASGTLFIGNLPTEQMRSLLDIRPRAVLVDYAGDPALSCPYQCVCFDNIEAARMAVRHLVDAGRRRIALLKGNPGHYFSREMEQGYRQILEERGLTPDSALVLAADFTADGACLAMSEALDRGLRLDGLFTNDEMALGALHALRSRGLRVPRDVAVMGCDGLPFGRHTAPPLSTVVLDHERLGSAAVELLFAARDGEQTFRRIRLVPALEVRETTVPREETRNPVRGDGHA